jgi:O-antigen/teichoic acid export membrane protein
MPSRVVAKFVSFNIVGNLLPLIFAAACIPVLTKHLGNERFGFLTLIWALIGYAGIFDLGISKALIYHSAKAASTNNPKILAPGIRSGIQVVASVGIVGLLLLTFGSESLAHYLVKGEGALVVEASSALIIVGLTVPATTVGNALRGALEGLSRFKAAAIVKIVTGSAFFIIPALLALSGISSLAVIALIFLIVRTVAAIWCWVLISREPLYISSRDIKATKAQRKELLSYGMWALVSSVISPLMVYGDRFVISGVLGVSAVGVYAILQETLGRSLFLAASYAGALQPGFTKNDLLSEKTQYRRYEKFLASAMLLIYLGVWIAAEPVTQWWLHRDLHEYSALFLIFVIALFFNSLAQLPYALLLAKGRPDLPAKYHVLEFLLYMPLCLAGTYFFGLNGAAAAWAFRVTLDYGLLKWSEKEILRL